MELRLLIRGAYLARDKFSFLEDENMQLSDVELEALEREDDPKLFKLPKALLVVLLTCCIGAIVQSVILFRFGNPIPNHMEL
jgi:hypothetical protein